jgi:hypothetical protein
MSAASDVELKLVGRSSVCAFTIVETSPLCNRVNVFLGLCFMGDFVVTLFRLSALGSESVIPKHGSLQRSFEAFSFIFLE